MKCNCENLRCDHWKKHDKSCDGEGTIQMQYVGLVCASCAEKHDDEFHVNQPIDKYVDIRVNRERKCIEILWLDKWRGVRYWPYDRMPSKRIIDEAMVTFKMNVGKSDRLVRFHLTWQPTV